MDRFLIIGQPRSGTTYLQTLLNSHSAIHCRGETFDGHCIDDDGGKQRELTALIARDADPEAYFEQTIGQPGHKKPLARLIGIKYLFYHSAAVLQDVLPKYPDIPIIYVTRPNKLAVFASLVHARQTKKWTQARKKAPPEPLPAGVRWVIQDTNRLRNEDFLLSAWLKTLPNPLFEASYTDLFADDFVRRICAFLEVEPERRMSSWLKKQGDNRIIDRFENKDEICAYFEGVGLGGWLGEELRPN